MTTTHIAASSKPNNEPEGAPRMNLSGVSEIELAKQLRALRAGADSETAFRRALIDLGIDGNDPRLEQILEGFGHEDEFELLCRLMGTNTAISRLGQTPLQGHEPPIAPDFLASFRPEHSWWWKELEVPNDRIYGCCIEVKGTLRPTYGLTVRDLRRREAFASMFQLPLVFAIRFLVLGKNFWLILDSGAYRNVKRLNRKIRPDDLQLGIGHIILDDYFIMPRGGLCIDVTFDSEASTDTWLVEFGKLTQLSFLVDGERQDIPSRNCDFVFTVLRCFSLKLIKHQADGRYNSVTYAFVSEVIALSAIVSTMNQLLTEPDTGKPLDRGRLLARLDSATHAPFVLSRSIIESIFFNYPDLFRRLDFEPPTSFLPKIESLFRLSQVTPSK